MENENKKPGKVKPILFAIWVIIAYFIPQIIVSVASMVPLIIDSLNEAAGDMNAYQDIYLEKVNNSGELLSNAQFAATLLSLALVAIWYYCGYVKDKVDSGHTVATVKKVFTRDSILLLVGGTVAIYGIAVYLEQLLAFLMPEMAEGVNNMLNLAITGNPVLGLIMAVVLAPIGEEICVRGIILSKAKLAYGMIGCMVISAVFFGILHMNLLQGIYTIPMGLFWGYLAYKYKSVIPSIICHALNNLFGSLGAGVLCEKALWSFAIFIVVGGAVAIYFGKKIQFDVE